MAQSPTKSGPEQSQPPPPQSAAADDDERTRVAGPPQPDDPAHESALPSHLLRSGEIEPRNPVLPAPPTGGWEEEKTVVDDSQLHSPKGALGQLLTTGTDDEQLTIDEPQKPVSFPMPSAAPKQTVRGQAPPPSQGAGGKLVVVAGNDRGREFPLGNKTITVGRGIDNDVVLTDIAVSRRHLSLELDGAQYKLLDTGSGNGTLVNDDLQDGPRQLRHGDRIEIGNTVFRFEHPATAGDKGNGAVGRATAAGMPPAPGSSPAPMPPSPVPGAAPGPAASASGQNRAQLPPPGPGTAPPGPAQPRAPSTEAARPMAAPRPSTSASFDRARSAALAQAPASPRNTLIGLIAAAVSVVGVAMAGLLLGDDEHLAGELAPAAGIELPLDLPLDLPLQLPFLRGGPAGIEGITPGAGVDAIPAAGVMPEETPLAADDAETAGAAPQAGDEAALPATPGGSEGGGEPGSAAPDQAAGTGSEAEPPG